MAARRWGAPASLAAALIAAAAALGTGQECEAGVPYNFSCSGPNSANTFLPQKTDPSTYSRTERPRCGTDAEGDPTLVEVMLVLRDVGEVDLKVSSMLINGYLRITWKDPRLASATVAEGGCLDITAFAEDISDRIWTPDLSFENLISAGNGGAQSTRVFPDGRVRVSKQVQLKVKLNMDLGKLPYDEHVASLMIASTRKDAKLHVIPSGGTPGESITGVGVEAGNLESLVWTFPNTELEDPSEGFSTPGRTWNTDGRDFVSLEFPFKRKPKFFIDQVCVPSMLFLLVSYLQFFVPKEAAPARATLAVVPVLIMCTLSNSVYESLPQGSQRMWLGDFLQAATFLCCFAALEFGLVQLFFHKEACRTAKRSGVLQAKPILERLLNTCATEGITLSALLNKCEKQECSAHEAFSGAAKPGDAPVAIDIGRKGGTQCVFKTSDDALKFECKETDLSFLNYALEIYQSFDSDGSEVLNIPEIRQALWRFNIYMHDSKLAAIVCMFLRDIGNTTPVNEREVVLDFGNFTMFIMTLSNYSFVETTKLRSASKRVAAKWQAMGPAHATDAISRFGIIIIIAFPLVMHLIRPLY